MPSRKHFGEQVLTEKNARLSDFQNDQTRPQVLLANLFSGLIFARIALGYQAVTIFVASRAKSSRMAIRRNQTVATFDVSTVKSESRTGIRST